MFKKILKLILKHPSRSLLAFIMVSGLLVLSWLAMSETGEKKQEPIAIDRTPECKSEIVQPSCYQSEYPTPIFKWQGCNNGIQKQIRVQVDDFAYFSNTFPSPEFDSGKINSLSSEYKIEVPGLEFGRKYYWGVTIYSDSDRIGGWWGWGDQNFTVAPACQN